MAEIGYLHPDLNTAQVIKRYLSTLSPDSYPLSGPSQLS